MRNQRDAALIYCADCAPEGTRAALAAALEAAGLTARLRLASAPGLGSCDAPVALALRGEGRAAYLFAGVAPATDGEDIGATCRLWLESEAGWIEDARPCGRLRFLLKARVPG
ncbi:MAG: DUF1636 family protein [Pikeienuella sp.]